MTGAAAGTAPGSDVILDRLLALHPKVIDLTLDRVRRLLAELDHPERSLPPVVHIAGTNGKGSTLAMIRAGLEAEGASCHAYTSPHLVRFHERIRIAGELIPEPDLARLLAECEEVNAGRPITFFEITTCAAFLAFARAPADFTLLEVGLGGRLDATNVVDRPGLTVITPVSLDHQQYLGETLAEIAFEKAGILKRGVPCVVAPQADAARAVIEDRAAEVGAPLLLAGQDWQVRAERGRVVFEDGEGLLDIDPPRLPGAHQIENAGTAVAALRALGRGPDAPQAALARAEWPARLQRLTRGPLVEAMPPGVELWLDGGHNPSAGQALADHLAAEAGRRPTLMVLGMLDTKDVGEFLRPLAPLVAEVRTVDIPGSAAAIPAADLADRARAAGMRAAAASSPAAALAAFGERMSPGSRVLICGSLYLAGAVLAENG